MPPDRSQPAAEPLVRYRPTAHDMPPNRSVTVLGHLATRQPARTMSGILVSD
jgi:hypothetical protein